MKKVICKTGLSAGTLSNNADQNQMPNSTAYDQGLHCLFKLPDING